MAKARKHTIESVVTEAGITLNSYNSYRKRGKLPRADEAYAIARVLNTTLEYLLTGEISQDDEIKIAYKKYKPIIDSLGYLSPEDINNLHHLFKSFLAVRP
ncbi:MAG: helix-turn-helix transcriptional regulator [Spirochaetaceae bacterium]|nr:helix-turn-helix transcriptional regulator [Spirochaetaceae bacterium]